MWVCVGGAVGHKAESGALLTGKASVTLARAVSAAARTAALLPLFPAALLPIITPSVIAPIVAALPIVPAALPLPIIPAAAHAANCPKLPANPRSPAAALPGLVQPAALQLLPSHARRSQQL